MTEKNFVDKMFDMAEEVVGGMEKSKEFAEGPASKDDAIDAEFTETKKDIHIYTKESKQPKLLFGVVSNTYHLFEGFAQSGICGQFFEKSDITDRRTEAPGEKVDSRANFCCSCVRIIHARYQHLSNMD